MYLAAAMLVSTALKSGSRCLTVSMTSRVVSQSRTSRESETTRRLDWLRPQKKWCSSACRYMQLIVGDASDAGHDWSLGCVASVWQLGLVTGIALWQQMAGMCAVVYAEHLSCR